MSVKRLTTRGIATAQAIANREEFKTSGSLEGTSSAYGAGMLHSDDRDKFYADRNDIVYSVYSYATPIYWLKSDGTSYKVTSKFSVTTTKHQGNLYLV